MYDTESSGSLVETISVIYSFNGAQRFVWYSCEGGFNSLPNNKILNMSKLKAFVDDNFIVAKMLQFFFDSV